MAQPLPIPRRPLTEEELATYAWQMWVPGFGEAEQERLKGASVLVSRCGGLGGVVAFELAAAGIGRLVLAHGGNVKPSDLNRQLLMTYDDLGKPRSAAAERTLKKFNPRLEILAVSENVSDDNAVRLVSEADLIVDCAPLFPERYALNREAMRQRKPLVECAMYELEATLTTIIPGETPCLECTYPEPPSTWRREFPVFGAVSGTVACLGAMEAIKVLCGLGEPLLGTLITMDLRDMRFRRLSLSRREGCSLCASITAS